ncbi:MAG: 16S rRNA processing protein RimM [Bacteroidia bacterium]|jgi:16S rRNA processing protein RimM
MISSPGPLLEVGRVIKTHGYEGKVRFEIFNSIDIDSKEPIFMMFDHKPVPFFITEISTKNPYIVAIDNITTLDQAQQLLGKGLYLPKFHEPEEEEDTLIGYTIFDTTHGRIGTVKEITDNGAQDLLVVEFEDKEIMIPFVDELVESISDSEQTITFNLPDGLIQIDK